MDNIRRGNILKEIKMQTVLKMMCIFLLKRI